MFSSGWNAPQEIITAGTDNVYKFAKAQVAVEDSAYQFMTNIGSTGSRFCTEHTAKDFSTEYSMFFEYKYPSQQKILKLYDLFS